MRTGEHMYHVKDDKRSLLSAELIYNGLMECLKTKPLDQVTITEIVEAAGVSRATFYRCFDSPVDVLHMKCDACFEKVINGLLREYEKGPQGRDDLMVYFFRFWMDHSDLLDALIDAKRLDIIYECQRRHFDKLADTFFPQMDTESEEYVYFIALRTGILTSMLMAWGKTGRKKKPEELIPLITGYMEDVLQRDVFL